MRATMKDATEIDKSGAVQTCRRSGTNVPNNFYAARVMQKARDAFGAVKTAFSVSKVVGVHERTARHWKQDNREIDLTEFMRLAKSDTELGAALFGMLWADLPDATKALWEKQRELERKQTALREKQRALAREFEEAEMAQAELQFARR